jgi:hypothetical protein
LESFRNLLRKVGAGASELSGLDGLAAYVRDCNDALAGEYQKAQAEWARIDESFVRWAGVGIAGSGLVTGHLVPDVAAWSVGTIHTIGQLGLRYFRQQQFRKTNPMSVFIDLSRREPRGVTIS